MEYLIDSYAWIEYFIGSAKGEKLRQLLLTRSNTFSTIICSFAEIRGWSLKNNKDFNEPSRIICANSTILQLNERDWIKAAEERFMQQKTQKDFGLIDAAILIKQKERNCKIVSGDKHFKGKDGVVYLS